MSDRLFDLLSLGELLLRLSPSADERLMRGDTFQRRVGGTRINVAVGISLLGLHIGAITKLPTSDMGNLTKNKIRSYGISDNYSVYDSNQNAGPGLYYYEYDAYPRKPKVIYDRESSSFYNISEQEFPKEIYKAAACSHVTGITLALCSEIRKTAINMMKRFEASGTIISFDVDFRGSLWTGDETEACIREILPFVDISFYSGDTVGLTFHKTEAVKEMTKNSAEEYPTSALASTQRVIHSPKSHTFGPIACDVARDEYYGEEPYHNIEVIDRISSGDTYIAGALYGLSSSGGDYMKVVQYGNAASAVKNTIPGDLSTSGLEEVSTIIKEYSQKGPQSEMSRQKNGWVKRYCLDKKEF